MSQRGSDLTLRKLLPSSNSEIYFSINATSIKAKKIFKKFEGYLYIYVYIQMCTTCGNQYTTYNHIPVFSTIRASVLASKLA